MRRNWATIACLATMLAGPVLADPPINGAADKPEPKLLTTAIAKANKIIGKQYELDRATVEESKAFSAPMKVTVSHPQVERRPDGSVSIAGEIQVSVLPEEKYWSAEERAEIGRLQRNLIKAKGDLNRAISQHKQEWERRTAPGGKIMRGKQLGGWYHIHSGAHITDAAYEQKLANIRDKHQKIIDQIQTAVDALRQPIDERVKREKLADDTVKIQAMVDAKLAKTVDWPAVASSDKTLFFAKVQSYDTIQMPPKVGIGLRISQVGLDVTGFAKSRLARKK